MRVKPTARQLKWQRCEMGMFLHFGVNTFTDREWGEGTEDPRVFNPVHLDARQWVRVAKDTGFRYMILTAKHHDGFCLWPSAYTEHSVKNSPWRDGRGDVMREFADACHEADMKMGFYLSPWDRHEPTYGDSPAYNAHFRNQLRELLTNYGDVFEVWFDGACGEGPNGKKQEYDWRSYYELIRELQPNAVIAICGPDVRWVGNESGVAPETEWSVQPVDPAVHIGVTESRIWYPSETDVSIRPGWFWHAREDGEVKSLSHLLDIYYQSVGRNSVLLLNVPPDDQGLLPKPDVDRLYELSDVLRKTFGMNIAHGAQAFATSVRPGSDADFAIDGDPNTCWEPNTHARAVALVVDLGRPVTFNTSMVQEHIADGQVVEEYELEGWIEGRWQRIVAGTTIGYKRLDRFPDVTTERVRLTIHRSRERPLIPAFGLYRAPAIPAA